MNTLASLIEKRKSELGMSSVGNEQKLFIQEPRYEDIKRKVDSLSVDYQRIMKRVLTDEPSRVRKFDTKKKSQIIVTTQKIPNTFLVINESKEEGGIEAFYVSFYESNDGSLAYKRDLT